MNLKKVFFAIVCCFCGIFFTLFCDVYGREIIVLDDFGDTQSWQKGMKENSSFSVKYNSSAPQEFNLCVYAAGSKGWENIEKNVKLSPLERKIYDFGLTVDMAVPVLVRAEIPECPGIFDEVYRIPVK